MKAHLIILFLLMISTDTINGQKNQFSALPKVELHLHLDCSLSYEVVNEINPQVTYSEYKESFIAPPKCTDLADYITRAIKGFELMQSLKILVGQVNDDPEIRQEIHEAFVTTDLRYEMLIAIMVDMSHNDATNNTTWLNFKQRHDVQ